MLGDCEQIQIQKKMHKETDARRWSVCLSFGSVELGGNAVAGDEFGNVAPVWAGDVAGLTIRVRVLLVQVKRVHSMQ
jgi:hypothetical protein